MKYIVYQNMPAHFIATVEAAGCFLCCNGKFLLLHRHISKPQGHTWGVPAGKLDSGESPRQAVIREVAEEIGIDVSQDLHEVDKLYIELPHISYVYHRFYKVYDACPEISLAIHENDDARWVSIDEALKLPLVSGGKEALLLFQKSTNLLSNKAS